MGLGEREGTRKGVRDEAVAHTQMEMRTERCLNTDEQLNHSV